MTVVGSPRVRLTLTSSTTDATLFVSWWKVASGGVSAPRRLVSPVRVATRPGVPVTVEVALPAGTYAMDQGTTWPVSYTHLDVYKRQSPASSPCGQADRPGVVVLSLIHI